MKKKIKDIKSHSDDERNIYSSQKTNSKKNHGEKTEKRPRTAKGFFLAAGKVLIALTLVGIIVLSIATTALTVYVMKNSENETSINLSKENILESGMTTFYGMNTGGDNDVEMCNISSGTTRIWVDITDVPEDVKNAFVAIEDKRFYEHEGVDFKRTFLAFLNMFLHFWQSEQGGSTITQQLIKNLTNDKDTTAMRKIREISRAMSLEHSYSKDQILQAYLNIVPIGGANGNYEGIGAAAKIYFDKDVQDLTLAEAASIAAITKAPFYYEPIGHPDHNKKRRDQVIYNMYDQGMITKTECDEAIATPVQTKPGKIANNSNGKDYQSYFVDTTIEEVAQDYSKKYGMSKEEVIKQLRSGGYKVYTTAEVELQNRLENLYESPSTFGWSNFSSSPQSAFVVYDMSGEMKAVVGGTGTKPVGDRSVINRATASKRRPGSSIKPLSVYAPAVERNLIHFSSVVKDEPIDVNAETGNDWPQNYSGQYEGNVLLYYAVEQSLNTVPVRLLQQITPKQSYDFLTNKLGFTDLESADINLSPLALGNFTVGVHLNELTNAYQIFGNGGYFTDSHTYTKVEDRFGNMVLQKNSVSSKVISSDTASVMNRLLRYVVTEGTAKKASLDNMKIEVIGKTGTTDDFKDYTFVGLTHDYIAGIWLGYDDPKSMGSTNNTTKIWHTIMSTLLKGHQQNDFDIDPSVVQKSFCDSSGGIANDRCPKVKTGYYRSKHMPFVCTVH